MPILQSQIAGSATTGSTGFNAKSYIEKRLNSYPPMADYLDAVVKGDQTQIQAYIDACLVVKQKYPKP